MHIRDHVYLVTGGSSGLGKATVDLLLSRGAFVAVLDLNPPSPGLFDPSPSSAFTNGAPEAKEKRWEYVECDVGDEESVDAAVEIVKKAFGGKKWGGVVHCGGVGMAGKVRTVSLLSLLVGRGGASALEAFWTRHLRPFPLFSPSPSGLTRSQARADVPRPLPHLSQTVSNDGTPFNFGASLFLGFPSSHSSRRPLTERPHR